MQFSDMAMGWQRRQHRRIERRAGAPAISSQDTRSTEYLQLYQKMDTTVVQ